MRTALCLLAALTLGAQDAEPRFYFDVHTAMPMGTLSRDVNDQFGFGLTLGVDWPVVRHFSLRTSFSWTGYRVDDRSLAARAFADMFDVSYSEDRLVLRSYALGVEGVIRQESSGSGPYALVGGGMQRARLYEEYRVVDENGNGHTTTTATWPSMDSAFLTAGFGYQAHEGFFVEGKVRGWRYNGVDAYSLSDSPLTRRTTPRNAVSLHMAVGVRF